MTTKVFQNVWYRKEDYWAIIIALGLVILYTIAFFTGSSKTLASMAIQIPVWSAGASKLISFLLTNQAGIFYLFAFFSLVFCSAAHWLGYRPLRYLAGFTLVFILSIAVSVLGANQTLKEWQLETPLLALMTGMLIGNVLPLPVWVHAGLRTEFYVKVGIVLMGAVLPFTVILQAGPLAIVQATIVAVSTFVAIYLAATRIFGLDERFGATLAAGGSICGVSAAIAIGGACRAEKEHVSVSISIVILWAVAMVFALPLLAKQLAMAPGPAGAWIGTSEFADAAGFAAAEAMADERAVKTFTLMKVVGRDMFVGIWALLAAFLSVTRWEGKKLHADAVDVGEIWRRFPKFIIGFFAASIFTTLIIACLDAKTAAAFGKAVIGPLKSLRGWAFTWTFLCIGLTTRIHELTSFGWKPLAAFTAGVLINVPLGYLMSNILFVEYWLGVK